MIKRKRKHLIASIFSGLALIQSHGLLAQTVPDAGRVLQELQRPPSKPQGDRDFPSLVPPAKGELTPAGISVEIRSVHLAGNSLFSSPILLQQIGEVTGRKLDLVGMRALAAKIAAYYRSHGYPFTRVYVPAQNISNGELRIQIVEGRYGHIAPGGDPALEAGASRFLRALHPGDPIEASSLERVMLLLDNEPGMRVSPTMAPGAESGQGDLTAHIERVARFGGEIGADDAGDRYTGMYREKISAYAYSPFIFGDLITLRGIHTDENLWLGSLDYEVPLSGNGLRGHVGYSRTTYELGGQFEALGASGYANSAIVGVSYPIVRSRQHNLLVALDYQYQSLQDRYAATATIDNKHCQCFPLTVQFDNRDGILGGGLTYGSLIMTAGTLSLSSGLASIDAATARTAGTFRKFNIDVSRIQAIAEHVNIMVRYSVQLASKNLDSSEQFNLGGVYGVRAYPVGEGIADRGWLLQTELRYLIGDFAPYLLYDTAYSQTNVYPWDTASDSRRNLSGAGLGSRYSHGPWALDASMAWRIKGGRPVSDTKDVDPRIWVSAGYRF